jgi:flagellar basal body-associated protein FliL
MKKQLIIISGVGIILLLLAVWAYLLFFGTPKSSDELLNDLGLNNQSQNQEIVENIASTTTDSTLNTERPKITPTNHQACSGF